LPRAQLDQELATLPAGAAALDGVDAWRGEPGGARRQINLLPAERRARRLDMRLPLNLGLAALVVILFVVNMDESLTNRAEAVESMRAEVDKSNTEARQVAALRKTLADSIAGANFLSDKKRNSPLTDALLDDLTRRLPEDTYLERLQIENGQAQLQGQAKEAAKLIALLSNSTCLGDPRLQGQIQPDPRTGKERFQITADVKACNTAPDAKAAPGIGAGTPRATADAPLKTDAVKSGTMKPGTMKPDTGKADASKKEPLKKDAPKKDIPKKGTTTLNMPASRGKGLLALAAQTEVGRASGN
jgi:general secretion pathway protein L